MYLISLRFWRARVVLPAFLWGCRSFTRIGSCSSQFRENDIQNCPKLFILAVFRNGIIYVLLNTAMESQDSDTPIYSIGTVARLLGISVEVIRLYERKGLILTSRSEGQQRLYSESDVERLRCIRAAINDHKISIEGIRRIHSMVPCWEYIRCADEERMACPAYNRSQSGCWTYRHEGNACAARSCRECGVYRLSADCEKVRELILHRVAVAVHSAQVQQEGSAK